jgi:XTP/dITP diphosphohydrolase
MFNQLVLASNNAGKLREFTALLAPLGVTVLAQQSLNVPECPGKCT